MKSTGQTWLYAFYFYSSYALLNRDLDKNMKLPNIKIHLFCNPNILPNMPERTPNLMWFLSKISKLQL